MATLTTERLSLRLVTLARDGNQRSARVAERAGMPLERELTGDGPRYLLYATSPPPAATLE